MCVCVCVCVNCGKMKSLKKEGSKERKKSSSTRTWKQKPLMLPTVLDDVSASVQRSPRTRSCHDFFHPGSGDGDSFALWF